MASETVKVKEYLRYPFTEEETREIAKNLALSVTAKPLAEIEITQIQRLSNNINMGWEMREIECVVFNFHVVSEFHDVSNADTP